MTRRGSADEGFTLIEMLMVIAIMGVGMAIAVAGFQTYAQSAEHTGTRDSVVSALRAANQRALTEASTYCVRFAADGTSWTTYRSSCAAASTSTVVKGPESISGDRVSLTAVNFLRADGSSGSRDVEFTARGTASKGSLKVTRIDASTTYTVSVEGLTARVSAS